MLIEYCELLESSKKFVLARQLLRAGTSIGANAMESQNAESKADFIHKLKLLLKKQKKVSIGYGFAIMLLPILIVKFYLIS